MKQGQIKYFQSQLWFVELFLEFFSKFKVSYFRSKLAMTTFITKHTLYEKMPQVAILTLLKGAFRWSAS